MAKTKSKVYDTADNIKPYVERAMADEKLRADVMNAFKTAKKLYGDLAVGDRAPVTIATRVATDNDIREKLRFGDRGPAERERTAPGEARPKQPLSRAARRGHRDRDPLQPGHGA